MFIVRKVEGYREKRHTTEYQVDADSAEITRTSENNGTVVGFKKDGQYVGFFYDWDACYRDDLVKVVETPEKPAEGSTNEHPPRVKDRA